MSIVVKNLSFSYAPPQEKAKAKEILKNVNLQVNKGEFVVLSGPSGCGKSTLALTLTGLIPNSITGSMQGRVLINNHDTVVTPIKELSKHIGLVFQNPDNQLFKTFFETT